MRSSAKAFGLVAVIVVCLAPPGPAWAQQPVVYFTRLFDSEPFTDPVYTTGESGFNLTATISLRREGVLQQAASVRYWTEDRTAVAGEDYVAASGTVVFPVKPPSIFADSLLVQVAILDDAIAEGDQTFLFHIEVTGGAILGGAATAEIVITDDDGEPGPPTVSFDPRDIAKNRRGDYIAAGELCPGRSDVGCLANVRVRVDGVVDEAVTVHARVMGFPRPQTGQEPPLPVSTMATIEPGESGFLSVRGKSGIGEPNDVDVRPSVLTVDLIGADGAGVEIGEPSRVFVVFRRRSELDGPFGASSSRCAACDAAIWMYDAVVTDECPDLCLKRCSRPAFLRSGAPLQNGSTDTIGLLRSFRDEVMSRSAAGRYYTRAYDGLSADLSHALFASPGLIFKTFDAQDAWLAGLEALTEGRGDTVRIAPQMVDDLLEILQGLKDNGSPALRALIQTEEERLDLAGIAGMTFDEFQNHSEQQGGGFRCQEDATTLCLNDDRFWVQVRWTNFKGKSGVGRAESLSGDTGMFWFFDPDNIELVVKVLDGRGSNGNFWVFYGALTNVEFMLTVMDTETGVVKTYHNPLRQFASVGDNEAFPPVDEASVGTDSAKVGMVEGLASAAWEGARDRVGRWLDSVWPSRLPTSAYEPLPGADSLRMDLLTTDLVGRADCVPSATALCLNEERFRIEVEWKDFKGRTGVGRAVPLTADTGYFWFFDDTNVELMVKVLDGRGSTGHFWVFYGALTNVEYTLTVTDVQSGRFKTYFNPRRTFGSVGDTEALPGN